MRNASHARIALACLALLVWTPTRSAAGDKVPFRIVVTNNGKPATAEYQLLAMGSHDDLVAKGTVKGNTTVKVPPDQYRLRITLTEALDKPVETRDSVTIPSSGDGKTEIKFETGTITLVIYKGGQKKSCKLKLRRPGGGEWMAAQSDKPITLTPGEYEAELTIANVPHTVHGLFVNIGGTQNIPVQL